MILVFGAALGLISVAFGAFAEHGLRDNVAEEKFRFLMTAVRYNQVHAVLISAIGLALLSEVRPAHNMQAVKWSGVLFTAGTILFSFSIYFSVTLGVPAFLSITPFGGITLIAAWALLLFAGLAALRKN